MRRLCAVLLGMLALAGPAGAAEPITTLDEREGVGPGTTLQHLELLDARGWTDAWVLRVELGAPGLVTDALFAGSVTREQPISATANEQNAIAAVNGDFFDINNTFAPTGGMVRGGELVKGPNPTGERVAGVSSDGLGRLADLALEGSVTLPSGSRRLAALNMSTLSAGEIGLFNALWGDGARARSTGGAARVTEVLVRDGRVERVEPAADATGEIPGDGFVLVGRDAGADALAALAPGDPVTVDYKPRATGADPLRWAIAGGNICDGFAGCARNTDLLLDGRVLALPDGTAAPRTAIGFSADARTMFLAVADGRRAPVAGPTLRQMAELMARAGADDAMNLDGGGSSTMVAREAGREDASVRNRPSDGSERPVPNGVGLFARGSGELTGFAVQPLAAGRFGTRVFPGLTRKLVARGHDEALEPAPGRARFSTRSRAARVSSGGVVTGRRAGSAPIYAYDRGASGKLVIRVLDELDRLEAAPGEVNLAAADAAPERVQVSGRDAHGYRAPVHARDLLTDYDSDVVAITSGEDGALVLTPKREGSTIVTLRARGVELRLPVTVGLQRQTVSGFDELAPWKVDTARAAASAATAPGRTGGEAIRVSFDFTQSTATRTAGLVPSSALELPGQPRRIGWWVQSDGEGEWTSATIRDAAGVTTNLYGPFLDTPGWKNIEVPVPSGARYPLTLVSLRAIETKASRSYKGTVSWDDLYVESPPAVEPAEQAPRRDPMIADVTPLPERGRWTFATISDVQFTAGDPTPELTDIARRELREIVAARPDFLVINGDFTDLGTQPDIDLAKRILDEEVEGKVPYHYVPGNHESFGPGNLGPWSSVFGETYRTFDHGGVRFFLLNSSLGTLRASDFSQLPWLQSGLEAAERDPAVEHVVVLAHHPTEDPLPSDNSQLADRKEARLIEDWLTGFREDSDGKGAAYLASHAQNVNVDRVDGVPYMVLPPAGKVAYGAPDQGGVNGWARFAVAPWARASERTWLQAEVRPNVDGAITLRLPVQLSVGEEGDVGASFPQRGGRTVPVRYPVSAVWSGDSDLTVGSGRRALRRARREGDVAILDPVTLRLTALRKGDAIVRVSTGGESAQASLVVGGGRTRGG